MSHQKLFARGAYLPLTFVFILVSIGGCKRKPTAEHQAHVIKNSKKPTIDTRGTRAAIPIKKSLPGEKKHNNLKQIKGSVLMTAATRKQHLAKKKDMPDKKNAGYTPQPAIMPRAQKQPESSMHTPPAKIIAEKTAMPATKTSVAQNVAQTLIKKIVSHKPLDSLIDELDFEVENLTGKTVYVTCFSYLHRRIFSRWRWAKSPIYEIKNKESKIIDLLTLHDNIDRESVFGYLAIFNTRAEAEDAVYELLTDDEKIDLDLLTKLKGKKVRLEIERYGFKEPFIEYKFVKKKRTEKEIPELDFFVVNNTGKTVHVCCFAYLKHAKTNWIAALEEKDDMSVWRYDKTKVITLQPSQAGYIDVDTITTLRDQSNIFGYLAVFEENERKLANQATYELLPSKKKLSLGRLSAVRNKTIELEVERYGFKEDFIEYSVKPIRRIDFTKIAR